MLTESESFDKEYVLEYMAELYFDMLLSIKRLDALYNSKMSTEDIS